MFARSLPNSACKALLDQYAQRTAGLTTSGDNSVHAQKRLVADDDAGSRIEHAQALRHVIEGGGETANFGARPRTGKRAGRDRDQHVGKTGH
jgi:hypothetical protein